MTVTTDQIRILIAGDRAHERLEMRSTLESQDNLEIVGLAALDSATVGEVRRRSPDVVIIDATHAEQAVEATRQILDASPQTEVLITTRVPAGEMAPQVFQAGARAYVLESDGVQSLLAAIAALSRHKPFLTGQLAEDALDSYMREHQMLEADQPRIPRITPREREIIQLLCEGHSNKETASQLNISVKTVEAHRLNIMRKLRLTSLSHLVRYAIREGIVGP